MSQFPLHAIEQACSIPAPGLKALVAIDPDDLVTQPFYFLLPSISDLDFKPGKAAFAFHADGFTARLTDKDVQNGAPGDTIEYLLQGARAGLSPDIEWFRAKIRHRRIHFVATYQNGASRFLPWMRLAFEGDSGNEQNRNGYNFSATTRLTKPAPFFGGEFSVIGGTPVAPPAPGGGDLTTVVIDTDDPTYTYSVPSGKLMVAVVVRGTDAQTVTVGLSPGGMDFGGPVDMAPTVAYTFNATFRPFTATNVYLAGLTGTNTIEIWYLG